MPVPPGSVLPPKDADAWFDFSVYNGEVEVTEGVRPDVNDTTARSLAVVALRDHLSDHPYLTAFPLDLSQRWHTLRVVLKIGSPHVSGGRLGADDHDVLTLRLLFEAAINYLLTPRP